MSHTAPKIRTKTVSEVRNAAVNFSGKLDATELLTGTPVVSELTTSDLTFASEAVNTSTLTIDDVSAVAGEAVQFKVSGGVAGTDYIIKISCDTNSGPVQTLHGRVTLHVEAD